MTNHRLSAETRRLADKERERIEELLRQANRGTYRAIANTVGRSVFSVREIAACLVEAGEISLPPIGRPKASRDMLIPGAVWKATKEGSKSPDRIIVKMETRVCQGCQAITEDVIFYRHAGETEMRSCALKSWRRRWIDGQGAVFSHQEGN